MEIKRNELEELRDFLDEVADVIGGQIDTLVEYQNHIKEKSERLEKLIDADVISSMGKTKHSKLISPQFCNHVNKHVNQNGNSEVVVCKDCGLMLSYKQL